MIFVSKLDIYSLLANSTPVSTIFIEFRSAFDQLWHEGYLGKLKRLDIPSSYLRRIEGWLLDRRSFIEINCNRSRWFSIGKGGLQDSVLIPTLFITYHCDMEQFLSNCTSHFFTDDVAAIFSDQLDLRYTDQCIDLEKLSKLFLDSLDYYSCLAHQPLKRAKTEAMFSARAVESQKFNIAFVNGDDNCISWKKGYKYLGYIISSKLDRGKLI